MEVSQVRLRSNVIIFLFHQLLSLSPSTSYIFLFFACVCYNQNLVLYVRKLIFLFTPPPEKKNKKRVPQLPNGIKECVHQNKYFSCMPKKRKFKVFSISVDINHTLMLSPPLVAVLFSSYIRYAGWEAIKPNTYQ